MNRVVCSYFCACLCVCVCVWLCVCVYVWHVCICVFILAPWLGDQITHYLYLTIMESALYCGECGMGWSAIRPAGSWGRLRCALGILSIPWPIFLRTPCGRASILVIYLVSCCFNYCYFFFFFFWSFMIDYPDLWLICCTLYCNRWKSINTFFFYI